MYNNKDPTPDCNHKESHYRYLLFFSTERNTPFLLDFPQAHLSFWL